MLNYKRVARWMLYSLISLTGGIIGALGVIMASATVDQLPAWLQAFGSISAVLVSIVAIIFVKGTLDATQETLRKTEEMLELQDQAFQTQAQIGDLQTRAWVYHDDHRVFEDDRGDDVIQITLKNYGPTPALKISARYDFKYYDYVFQRLSENPMAGEPLVEIGKADFRHTEGALFDSKSVLSRERTVSLKPISFNRMYLAKYEGAVLEIECRYHTTRGVEAEPIRFTFTVKLRDDMIIAKMD